MYIEGAPVLHMVDDATYFSATQLVHPLMTESVWEIILSLWATACSGLPDTLIFDDGSQFRDIFVEICDIHDAEWQRSGTKHHNALAKGERYHEPIRRTFRKLRTDHPKLKKEFLLSLSFKACSDTLESEGVVPSALVFRESTSLRSFLGPKILRATLAERTEAALTAHKDMAYTQAQSKLKREFKYQSSSYKNHIYSPEDKVLVWRQKIVNNCIGEFIGPFIVLHHN